MRRIASSIILTLTLFTAASASAGISRIYAHGASFSPGDTIPVFVDSSTRNSIRVQGQFMDLCTDVDSNDSSFVVNIGDRIRGTNSAVEILVAAGNAPDLDAATITIKFVSGEETFRVKAFKSRIDKMEIIGQATNPACVTGQTVTLVIEGFGMDHLALSATAAMMEVADDAEGDHYDRGSYFAGTARATVTIRCKTPGIISISRQWFWDTRLIDQPNPNLATKLVRGSAPASIRMTVTAP